MAISTAKGGVQAPKLDLNRIPTGDERPTPSMQRGYFSPPVQRGYFSPPEDRSMADHSASSFIDDLPGTHKRSNSAPGSISFLGKVKSKMSPKRDRKTPAAEQNTENEKPSKKEFPYTLHLVTEGCKEYLEKDGQKISTEARQRLYMDLKLELRGNTDSVSENFTTTMIQDDEYYKTLAFDIKFPQYCVTASIDEAKDIYPSEIKPFCTLMVVLSKSPPYKLIKFITDDVGMITTAKDQKCIGNDSDRVKGFFNDSVSISITPVGGLPKHWHLDERAPNTANSENKYVHSTGWSICAKAGLQSDVLTGPTANAGLSLGYEKKKMVETNVTDFSIRDRYNGAATGWSLYYTNLDGKKKWKDHFNVLSVKDVASLAKSSLSLKAESVYRGPIDAADKIKWIVRFEPKFRLLRSRSLTSGVWHTCHTLEICLKTEFVIDMETLQVKF